jgi:hypothetical protein
MYLDLVSFTFEYSYFKAMSIIAKLSFWILQPPKNKKSIITELKLSFEDSILGGLDQFRTEGYVDKLKTSITPESLPSKKDGLLGFLYDQIAHTY